MQRQNSTNVVYFKKPAVLVVEDDVCIRMVTAEALRYAGVQVIEADDFPAAMKVLTVRRDVGLVVTDLKLARARRGLQFARWVSETVPYANVIIATGEPDAFSRYPDVRRNGYQIVAKPYDTQDLVATVSEILNR